MNKKHTEQWKVITLPTIGHWQMFRGQDVHLLGLTLKNDEKILTTKIAPPWYEDRTKEAWDDY